MSKNITNNTSRPEQLRIVQNEALSLFRKKNQDYGDAFAKYGSIGVLVRLGDKISRLISVTNKSITQVNTESLRDTLIDLHNYSAMAILLMDETSPPDDITDNVIIKKKNIVEIDDNVGKKNIVNKPQSYQTPCGTNYVV